MWLPFVKFKPGLFSDTGYRFRENSFEQEDNWIPGGRVKTNKFYDVQFFSSDEIEVGTDFNTIAEMYFRVKTDTILHRRKVFSMMNWFGAVAGIEQFLLELMLLFFGGYASFNSMIETVNYMCVN